MLSRHCLRVCGGLLLLPALLALAAGCGVNYQARGTVKGKVTFGGTHLTAGNVIFYGKEANMTGSAAIDVDGNYFINDAPLGEVKITVTVPSLPPGGTKHLKNAPLGPTMPGEQNKNVGKKPDRVVPIPEKYGKKETTDLTYVVTKGEQTHNIELKP